MTEAEIKAVEKRAAGKRNRISGTIFENLIERALRYYDEKGIARVIKNPEPMAPIKDMGKGKFLAHYVKPAQVDFAGTISGGRAVRFEAKQTHTEVFTRDRVSPKQMEDLTISHALGAYCFVIICFGNERCYRIPWIIWRDMKVAFGRLYIKESDVQCFRLPVVDGITRILADTKEEKLGLDPLETKDA